MSTAKFYYKDSNAPKPNKPNHIGTNAIIEYENMILLEHRSDNDSWGFVGGGLKINESLKQCLVREVKEETGILIGEEELKLYKIFDDPTRIASYADGNILRIITVVYKCKLNKVPNLVCSEESRELKFFLVDEIQNLHIVESHRPIVDEFIKGYTR